MVELDRTDRRLLALLQENASLSNLELAERVIRLTGSKSRVVHQSLPKDDPRQRRPDISLAIDKLGWRPTIELDEGLERTIHYFKGKL